MRNRDLENKNEQISHIKPIHYEIQQQYISGARPCLLTTHHEYSHIFLAQNFSTLIPTEERENVLIRGVTTTKNTNTIYHNLSSLICRNILSCTAIKDYRFKSSSHLHQDDLEILLHAEKVHKNKNEEIPHTKIYKPTHYEIQKTYLSGARSCLLTTHHKYSHIFLAQILSLCPPTKQGLK